MEFAGLLATSRVAVA